MEFELSEEHKMVQSLVRDFVSDHLKPLERDLLGRAADQSDAAAALPPEREAELVRMVQALGLWNAGVPEEFGGPGLDTLGTCLVEEELAQTVVPFRFGDVSPVLFECNEEQRERYMEPALRNEKQPRMAIFEPGDGDQAIPAATAELSDDDYILNGKKVSFGRAAEDFFAVVFARAAAGPTCFLVDKDTAGMNVSEHLEVTGWMAQLRQRFMFSFENCRVPGSNVLGKDGKAFHLGGKWLPLRRIVRGARAVGTARRLLEEAAIQAGSFVSFGKSQNGRLNVQAALADIAVSVHGAALMVYEAAWKADIGKPVQQAAATVKLATSAMLQNVADRVSHVFNGPSFTRELPMERLCRGILEENIVSQAIKRQRALIASDIMRGVRL